MTTAKKWVLLLCFGGMSLFLVGVGVWQMSLPTPAVLPLPTVVPTSECTLESVYLWQTVQEARLADVEKTASSASRTMPGERLNGEIARLQSLRMSLDPIPPCADSTVQMRWKTTLNAFDYVISVLNLWQTAQLDGTQFTIQFQQAEQAWREALK